MQTPLVIDFAHAAPSSSIEDAVRAGAARLNRYCHELIGCHATISGPCDGHHLAEPAHLHLRLTLPDAQFDVDHPLAPRGDTPARIEGAFDAAQRRLEDWMKGPHGRKARASGPSNGSHICVSGTPSPTTAC